MREIEKVLEENRFDLMGQVNRFRERGNTLDDIIGAMERMKKFVIELWEDLEKLD